jgi:flagellar hook-basal body complex protein FliE
MVEPISPNRLTPVGPLTPSAPPRRPDQAAPETSFTATLRQQLERVSQMQDEAEAGIQNLLTGRSQNITEVFAAARKAEVAFSLLMELRNKLTDAYLELKRMQV